MSGVLEVVNKHVAQSFCCLSLFLSESGAQYCVWGLKNCFHCHEKLIVFDIFSLKCWTEFLPCLEISWWNLFVDERNIGSGEGEVQTLTQK